MPNSCVNCFTTDAPPSSTDAPTTTNPCGPYLFCSATKPGISARQGPHHVAQKSRMTTLALKSEEWTVLPSRSLSSQFGAAGALLAAFIAFSGGAPQADSVAAREAANTMTGTKPGTFKDCIQGYEQPKAVIF